MQANCRSRFTAADFDFVRRALARRKEDAAALTQLFCDPDALDQTLDQPALLDALLSGLDNVFVSPCFYFYVLTRHALRRDGINDRALCDYIASVLVHFSRAEHLRAFPLRVADSLKALQEAPPAQAFQLRADLADSALFVTGIFPESVLRHSRRRGAPDVSFYEGVGRANYRALAGHQTAHKRGLSEIFERLAEQFHWVRLALNQLADRLLHLEDFGLCHC